MLSDVGGRRESIYVERVVTAVQRGLYDTQP